MNCIKCNCYIPDKWNHCPACGMEIIDDSARISQEQKMSCAFCQHKVMYYGKPYCYITKQSIKNNQVCYRISLSKEDITDNQIYTKYKMQLNNPFSDICPICGHLLTYDYCNFCHHSTIHC